MCVALAPNRLHCRVTVRGGVRKEGKVPHDQPQVGGTYAHTIWEIACAGQEEEDTCLPIWTILKFWGGRLGKVCAEQSL